MITSVLVSDAQIIGHVKRRGRTPLDGRWLNAVDKVSNRKRGWRRRRDLCLFCLNEFLTMSEVFIRATQANVAAFAITRRYDIDCKSPSREYPSTLGLRDHLFIAAQLFDNCNKGCTVSSLLKDSQTTVVQHHLTVKSSKNNS